MAGPGTPGPTQDPLVGSSGARAWRWWLYRTDGPFVPALVPRLQWKHTHPLQVANEPILAFTRGSPERDAVQKVRGCSA